MLTVPAPSFTDTVILTETGYPLPTSTPEDTCVVITVTVTKTSSSQLPPYPTGPVVPPKPTGTGSYSTPPPQYTGAASAMKVPAGVFGVLGLAAFVL